MRSLYLESIYGIIITIVIHFSTIEWWRSMGRQTQNSSTRVAGVYRLE